MDPVLHIRIGSTWRSRVSVRFPFYLRWKHLTWPIRMRIRTGMWPHGGIWPFGIVWPK
jgi:hypothetical protein